MLEMLAGQLQNLSIEQLFKKFESEAKLDGTYFFCNQEAPSQIAKLIKGVRRVMSHGFSHTGGSFQGIKGVRRESRGRPAVLLNRCRALHALLTAQRDAVMYDECTIHGRNAQPSAASDVVVSILALCQGFTTVCPPGCSQPCHSHRSINPH